MPGPEQVFRQVKERQDLFREFKQWLASAAAQQTGSSVGLDASAERELHRFASTRNPKLSPETVRELEKMLASEASRGG